MKTLKAKALDLVENDGPKTWKELHNFILTEAGSDPDHPTARGTYASYFSGSSSWIANTQGGVDSVWDRNSYSHGLLMRPTKKDPRYLEKVGNQYHLRYAEPKN